MFANELTTDDTIRTYAGPARVLDVTYGTLSGGPVGSADWLHVLTAVGTLVCRPTDTVRVVR